MSQLTKQFKKISGCKAAYESEIWGDTEACREGQKAALACLVSELEAECSLAQGFLNFFLPVIPFHPRNFYSTSST